MVRGTKFIILLLVIATVIFYVNNRIENYDMRFYFGKDDGLIAILESNILLSSFFFSIMAKKKWGKNIFIGLFVGFFASVISFFGTIPFANNDYFGLTFNIMSCMVFMITFFIREKLAVKMWLQKNKRDGNILEVNNDKE